MLLLLACSPPAPPPTSVGEVPTIDEIAYLAALRDRRPDLVRADCWNNVTLKPRYRADVLSGTRSYAALVAGTYTPAQRSGDLDWIRSNQRAELSFCAANPGAGGCDRICRIPCDICPSEESPPSWQNLPVQPSGYPLCGAVGYRLPMPAELYDATGAVEAWKVFFEFADDQLPPPELMTAFTEQLQAKGFRGDWKMNATSQTPEMARLQYNNLIVHAWSPTDATYAEEVGLAVFGGRLAGRGRGLDVGTPPDARDATDWHHFLCEGDPAVLPEEALKFVGFGLAPTVAWEAPPSPVLLPLSAYREEGIAGFSVLWHPDFVEDPSLQAEMTAALREDLGRVVGIEPNAFAGTRLVVDLVTGPVRGLPSRGHGIGVHRSAEWLSQHGFDPARAGAVEVYSASEFLQNRRSDIGTLSRPLTQALALSRPDECPEVALRLHTTCGVGR